MKNDNEQKLNREIEEEHIPKENPPYPPLKKGDVSALLLQRGKPNILKKIGWGIVALVAIVAIAQYIAADKYDAAVKVVEEGGGIGVNPMTERLDFGDLPKGNGLMRFVTIENGGKMDIYVKIIKTGNISDLIEINRNNFVLSSGDSVKIELLLEMPISANKEEYEGKIIIFKLPKLF